MSKTLDGKVALVTGGSRGIGAGIARRLASEGAAVAITYAQSAESAERIVKGIEAEGGRALAIRADAADPVQARAAVDQTAETFGRLDVLVNNAGILLGGTVEEFSVEDFDRIVAVNVRAAFVTIQAAAPHMRSGGRVINIGSMAAYQTTYAGSAFYSMTKGALAAMTRGFAIDLAPKGITVNNLQPGPTVTDISAGAEDRLIPRIPLRRFGSPDEIASFVAYLAGPDAGFVTGASLTVDGGLTA